MSAAFWRTRCATCAHYRERAAFGGGVGVCGETGGTVAESDTCEQHKERGHE
jgi:hypothetical protein